MNLRSKIGGTPTACNFSRGTPNINIWEPLYWRLKEVSYHEFVSKVYKHTFNINEYKLRQLKNNQCIL